MGYKYDQTLPHDTYRPLSESEYREEGPALPHRGPPSALSPRATLDSLPNDPPDAPPPYADTAPTYHSQPLTDSWTAQDPRSSSTQSLIPHDNSHIDGDGHRNDGKRILLLVYIHGFMGNETSFQSFPAHVHNLVTVKLEGSHVVHTKMYPKYKSRKAITFARDALSDWLSPHEGPGTDVVLLGHSMGGLLSAEVALLDVHRILGTINFDTPFQGMHPGVIASGVGSLFRPAPDSPVPKSAETKTATQDARTPSNGGIPSSASSYFDSEIIASRPTGLSSTSTTQLSTALDLPSKDPNFDPPFVNDVRLQQRTGWSNAWHFLNKHSDDLRKATQSYVKSHLEFGGAMADFKGLKNRYGKIRALEDARPPRRTRFVNYYTATTGRPKKPKDPSSLVSTQNDQLDGDTSQTAMQMHEAGSGTLEGHAPDLKPRISVEKPNHEEITEDEAQDHDKAFFNASQGVIDDRSAKSDASLSAKQLHSAPANDDVTDDFTDDDGDDERDVELDDPGKPAALTPSKSDAATNFSSSVALSTRSPSRATLSLPPMPDTPEEPAPFDPNLYTDKDTRKLAEKEHCRQIKAYKQAVKYRDKAIADRQDLVKKREKNAAKEEEKLGKAAERERIKAEQRGMEKGERERAKAQREEQKKSEKERLKFEKKRAKAESDKLEKAGQQESGPRPDSEGDASVDPRERRPKHDKRFCILPSEENGKMDPCWVRVFMPGVDEVGAHCGLFLVDGARYQWFVNDVAERIEKWVEERESN